MATSCGIDATLDLATAAREFQLDGFTVLRQFFSRQQAAQMRRRVQNYIETRAETLPAEDIIRSGSGSGEIVILAKLDRHDEFYQQLAGSPRLLRTARRLLGANVTASHVDFINKHRDAPVTQPHQDAYIFTRLPGESLTFWIPLDRVERENGCLCYVRGSHWNGFRAHDLRPGPNRLLRYTDEDRRHEVAVDASPGDLLVHHSFTIHRSADNPSDRPRWALAIPYLRSGSTVVDKSAWIALHNGRSKATARLS